MEAAGNAFLYGIIAEAMVPSSEQGEEQPSAAISIKTYTDVMEFLSKAQVEMPDAGPATDEEDVFVGARRSVGLGFYVQQGWSCG